MVNKKNKLKTFFQQSRIISNLAILIFSYLATLGVLGLIFTNITDTVTQQFIIHIITLPLFITEIITFHTISKKQNFRKIEQIAFLIFACCLSTIFIIGAQLDLYHDIIWSFTTVVKIFLLSVSFYPLLPLCFNFIKRFNIKQQILNNKKLTLIAFLVLSFIGLIFLIIFYPGIYGYDATAQIRQFLDPTSQPTSHFSLLYSLILSGFIGLGDAVFQNPQIGFFILILIQLTFIAFVLSQVIKFILRRTKNIAIYITALCFFCLFPLLQIMFISSAQDVIFSGIFVLIILNLFNMVFHSTDYWTKKRHIILLGCLILLLCLFRNNGLYAIAFLIIPLLIFNKGHRLASGLAVAIPIISIFLYTGPIMDLMNIQKENPVKEMSSVPSQQFARTLSFHPEALDIKDRSKLEEFYDLNSFNEYYPFNQMISDAQKKAIKSDAVSNNLIGYLSLYIQTGIKDPENYTEAFLMNTLGLWYPAKQYPDSQMYHNLLEFGLTYSRDQTQELSLWGNERQPLHWEENSITPHLKQVLYTLVQEHGWTKIPIISTLYAPGFYFIVTIICLITIFITRHFKLLIVVIPVLGIYITLFLSPVVLFRYCLPIIMIAPLTVYLIFWCIKHPRPKSRK